MKKKLLLLLVLLMLTGCQRQPEGEEEPGIQPEPAQQEEAQPVNCPEPEQSQLPENLPETLATAQQLDGTGGYLLLGQLPEQDIWLYCDNLEQRDKVYLRYGQQSQAFSQNAWQDPTILPELLWQDWDEDDSPELMVNYLRHEGVFFDGETKTPGLVYEQVVYQWQGDQWQDLHFRSSGPMQPQP